MSSLTLDPAELRDLLSTVLPFAEREGFMPVYSSVLVETRGGHVIATATDRYRAGHVKVKKADAPDFRALIPVGRCQELLWFYPVPRRRGEPKPVTLTVEDGRLTATQPGTDPQITVEFALTVGEAPDLIGFLRKQLQAATTEAAPTQYNAAFLASIKHLGNVTLKSAGPNKPLVILARNFVGAIMAQRFPSGVDPEYVGQSAEWLDLWGPEPEPTEAAA